MNVVRTGRGPRLITLMGFIAAFGFGCYALREPSVFSLQVVTTSTIAALITATIAAVVCRPWQFWAGFAVSGWLILIMCCAPWFNENVEPWLLSHWAIEWLYNRITGREVDCYLVPEGTVLLLRPRGWPEFDYVLFRKTAHFLVSMTAALLGGVAAVVLQRSNRGCGKSLDRAEDLSRSSAPGAKFG